MVDALRGEGCSQLASWSPAMPCVMPDGRGRCGFDGGGAPARAGHVGELGRGAGHSCGLFKDPAGVPEPSTTASQDMRFSV